MKYLTLLFCAFCISSVARAQTVGSIPHPEANWKIFRGAMVVSNMLPPIGIVGDTLIDEQSYFKILESNDTLWTPLDAQYHGALRVEDEKWYYRRPNQPQDELLYDFGLVEGDTITLAHYWALGNEIFPLTVSQIDTIVTMDGVQRKRWHLFTDNPFGVDENPVDVWIEGIGSLNGLEYSGYYVIDNFTRLTCYHEGDELQYMSPFALQNAGGCHTITSVSEHREPDLQLYPNPTDGQITLGFDRVIERAIVNIYSIDGRHLDQYSVIGSRTFRFELRHPPGVYVIQVATASGEMISSRVIKR